MDIEQQIADKKAEIEKYNKHLLSEFGYIKLSDLDDISYLIGRLMGKKEILGEQIAELRRKQDKRK